MVTIEDKNKVAVTATKDPLIKKQNHSKDTYAMG